MRESLWRIVTGEETAPTRGSESEQAKFASRRDRALATIVLTVDTSLLYLIGNPENPVKIWKKLALSVAGETIKEEDRVVYLLASLPESYNVLVTALETNEDVPKLEVVTERILRQERKFNNRSEASSTKESAMTSRGSFRSRACFHCGKPGHIRKNCYDFKAEKRRKEKKEKPTASQKAAVSVAREGSHSDSEESVLISIDDRALYTTSSHEQSTWIVDSGATTHMCHDKQSFTNLYQQTGKVVVTFTKSACYLLSKKHQMVAKATKVGSLYQLDYKPNLERASLAEESDSKEDIWHKRFGHLGLGSLQRLAREKLADGFDFDAYRKLKFCETCPFGKQHRTKFPSSSTRADEPFDLVHSDLCGKVNVKSESGAEYFLSFIDDKTR